ncbi:MAG: DNA-formamidopyrimidine glycosylase family protein [Lentisphaeria bacterium]
MPELPDVEKFKKEIEEGAVGRQVEHVHVEDKRILDDSVTPQSLGKRLKGSQINGSRRHGKFLFTETDAQDGWLLMHFGMTGYPAFCASEQDKPPHTRLVLEFSDNTSLAYACQRLLGKISWVPDFAEFLEAKGLGPDALAEDISVRDMATVLWSRKGTLKSTLMNQEVVAGIGNEWSDEILFQCRLHPKTEIGDLKFEDLCEVCRSGRRLLRTGARANCNRHPLPPHYLTAHRHSDGICPKCQKELEKIKVAGRPAYYCPNCQNP